MSKFTSVFITGDRMMTPFYPVQVMLEMLKARDKGQAIITGVNDGVESLVRAIADEAGVNVQVIEQQPDPDPANPGHWVDWNARHLALPDDCEFVSIHAEYQTCRITWSGMAVLPAERVRLVTLADLMGAQAEAPDSPAGL